MCKQKHSPIYLKNSMVDYNQFAVDMLIGLFVIVFLLVIFIIELTKKE